MSRRLPFTVRPDDIQPPITLPELDNEGATAEELETLLSEAQHLRPAISIQQQVRPEVLTIIRDMLLDGDDIDAIAILASELGLVPRPKRQCIWGFHAVVPAGNRPYLFVRECNAGIRWQPREIGLSAASASAFTIYSISDLAARREIHSEQISGEFFSRYQAVLMDVMKDDGATVLSIASNGLSLARGSALGVAMPFTHEWPILDNSQEGPRGGLAFTVTNWTDQPMPFTGFVTGDVIEED